ncbi:CBO0543 family protein [Bacillus sp. 37MA]|uniref:CBO0543 family protein n=1 Tax=Bacillus sp. 37MA TaxID=1132442 RepID=UPI00037F758E|nr:CBO0543 family protein [Bacillus sp. 37MA]
MYFIIIAFIIPWLIVLLHLHPKDKKLIPLIGPFGVVVSFLTNELGLYFGFWEVYPFPDLKTIATLPFNLGLFPILGCYMIFFIKKRMTHPYFVVFLATLFTTILEFIFVLMGKVTYGNGWNILWTFVSYLIPYLSAYWFYLYLIKLKVKWYFPLIFSSTVCVYC